MQKINIWCKTTLHIDVISLVDPLSGLGDVDCRYHRRTDRRTDTMNTIYPHLGVGFNKNANSPNHTMWIVNCKHSWKQRWMTFVLFLTRIVTLFFHPYHNALVVDKLIKKEIMTFLPPLQQMKSHQLLHNCQMGA